MFLKRRARSLLFQSTKLLPEFPTDKRVRSATWQVIKCRCDLLSAKVDALPARLRDMRVCVGDVSPSDLGHLLDAVTSGAQAVQVDFDDGHCPTWRTQLQGLYNTIALAQGRIAHPQVRSTFSFQICRERFSI